MEIKDSFIAELQNEGKATRRMLERVPPDKRSWKPHEKSTTLGYLTWHIANLFGWISSVIETTELDFEVTEIKEIEFKSTDDLLNHFDKLHEQAMESLLKSDNEIFSSNWILRKGDYVILNLPKSEVLRGICFNHIYHHRGQLSVYLRLLNVPVPATYGPSADEPFS
ncbi:MAG: hypothetical protein OZ913_01945 [Ignavibacteriaceae bacterium]|jgi:Uncharacterized protein conserved in bacteria|nr:MAG: hypothetical protein EDM69_07515 [Chlorobiota bacterium]KXK04674.1 MAG: DinB family protein [Chlorobi bacterium OLB4]MBV6399463.1 hypothetical protein [Ignavibacteria bacterium]MCC6886693.1 hypothetical protein [Ignavibacteriales bacterium]MCE7953168.1 hypothetical protein [Chlorobi bacterium CHB7]MEB2329049.1 hypothetical protein [Ignavibacteriaceae bacterium]OQY76584.1 MAG: hypothetical protein B6D43_10420 [Ignavibacteriales bacterium UTCHB1]RIK50039.1 MAG: damage-inducible protein